MKPYTLVKPNNLLSIKPLDFNSKRKNKFINFTYIITGNNWTSNYSIKFQLKVQEFERKERKEFGESKVVEDWVLWNVTNNETKITSMDMKGIIIFLMV